MNMHGRNLEKGVFGLVDGARELVGEVVKMMAHPQDESVAETGIEAPETFSVSLEEGGKSRFLPALAIAIAAVSPEELGPKEAFEELKSTLKTRKRPISRSDKTTSTPNTIKALMEEDSTPEFLEDVDITHHPIKEERLDRASEELGIIENRDRSVLLMPFNRKLFNTTVELPPGVTPIPMWGVVFGAFRPSDNRHKANGVDLSPMSVLYRVAFPVPPGLVGHESEGTIEEIPSVLMTNMLSRRFITPGYKNLTYVVSDKPD